MSEQARAFVQYLQVLQRQDRGALAKLRRSASFAPGADPAVYPYVERFCGGVAHANDSWRQALYITAAMFAIHPVQAEGRSFASAFGHCAQQRDSSSLERRFISLIAADSDQLSNYLRQCVSLLSADSIGCDYMTLLDDLAHWCNPFQAEQHDRIRQRWARDFYRTDLPIAFTSVKK